MALKLIHFLAYNAQPYQDQSDPQQFGTTYETGSYYFNTETLLVETPVIGNYDDYQNANPPQQFSWPITEEVHGYCEGTTRHGFFHLGDGSVGPSDTPDSTICGYVDPDPDPDPDPEPGGPLLTLSQAPADWAPVHLPVLLTLLAVPGADTQPREVLCYLDVSSDAGTTWQPAGKVRRTADAAHRVQFNLSEFLKSQFSIVPPALGLDRNLALRWRARLGFAPGFTGEAASEQLRLDSRHVVNGAAPNAGLGTYLSDLLPLPDGYPYRLSKIGSAGVSNLTTLPGVVPAECPPYPLRLVWLNQKGGWNSFVFTGKHEHGTDVTGGASWTDSDGAERAADLGAVRAVVKVYSDRLTPALAALVRTVRHSVQVYAMPDEGPLVAVRLVPGSFPDYREGEKSPTVDFTIRYPRQAVQTQ